LRRHWLDNDFLSVENAVDHKAEDLTADLGDHDKAVVAASFTGAQDVPQVDQRQELVAQPQHRRVLDAFDAMLARTSSSTESCGKAKRSPADSTINADTIASVSGILMVNLTPAPATERRSTVPPICSILLRTTSMPTPRPEILVTRSAVEKPGAK